MRISSDKVWAIAIAAVTVVLVLVVYSERGKWESARQALCKTAEPAVKDRATRQQVLERVGPATVEYTSGDLAALEQDFGPAAQTDKVRDANAWLAKGGRVLVYSRNDAVMFIYVNAEDRAQEAKCYLQ